MGLKFTFGKKKKQQDEKLPNFEPEEKLDEEDYKKIEEISKEKDDKPQPYIDKMLMENMKFMTTAETKLEEIEERIHRAERSIRLLKKLQNNNIGINAQWLINKIGKMKEEYDIQEQQHVLNHLENYIFDVIEGDLKKEKERK